jgi:hypothetical protein
MKKTVNRVDLKRMPISEFAALVQDKCSDLGIKFELVHPPETNHIDKPAHPSAVWRIKDGFVCRISDMTDMHLMSLYMMLLGKAREGSMTLALNNPDRDDNEDGLMSFNLFVPEDEDDIARRVINDYEYRTLVEVENELRHRDILGFTRVHSF